MNFDLEIQPNNIQLINLPSGSAIPNSAIPISYYNVNQYNIIPSDIVQIEEEFTNTSSNNLPVQTISKGSNFDTISDMFMITHISKYSSNTGVRTPLFYKHIITLPSQQYTPNTINSILQGIKIYDINNNI